MIKLPTFDPRLPSWRPVEKIGEGTMLRRGHGIAYRTLTDGGALTMVIPMNIIVGWARRFWIWLRFEAIPRTSPYELVRRDAYAAGHRAGMILEGERTGKLLSSSYRPSGIGGGR